MSNCIKLANYVKIALIQLRRGKIMIAISGNGISKSFGIDTIIKDASFTIQDGEKAGIVGINGAGKSTVFKILAGLMEKDDGEIFIGKGKKLGYMAQDFDFDSDSNIWEEMLKVFSHLISIETALTAAEGRISSKSQDKNEQKLEQDLKDYSRLQEEYQLLDGWSYKSRIRGVLKGLGFSEEDYEKSVHILSGGQKTRIALGKALLYGYDILMLDEPTNYLDIESVEWLEDYIKNSNMTFLVVSHDRYFLDKICNRIIEIENGKSEEYSGNYSKFLIDKAALREVRQKEYDIQQKDITRQQAIIERFRMYNREKSIKQAESREKALNRIELVDRPDNLIKSAHFSFDPKIRSGNDVLHCENLSKSFDDKLFSDVSFDVRRGEKIALLGANGIGKTTLLKIIMGQIKSETGFFKVGSNVNIAYYDQEQTSLSNEKNVIDEVWDENPGLNQTSIRNMLGAFLFEGEDVFKEISVLSGGEKSRLALLKLMIGKSNFIIMDEPTNHLDIPSREVLEKALSGYSGTLLFVSHDRYFVDKIATRILDLTSAGTISYPGNYNYYASHKDAFKNTIRDKSGVPEIVVPDSELKTDWLQKKEDKAKERSRIKRIEQLEDLIASHETRVSKLDKMMLDSKFFSNHVKIQELHKEKNLLENELLEFMEEWDTIIN